MDALGHRFRTQSDTEVLVEGYAACGIDVLGRLHGMFAIAIHDAAQDRLLLPREATRLRAIPDVSVGAFLSGDVDSSVVALMAQFSSKRVKTFAIGFEEQSFDERPYARMVAQRYGTDHQELTIRPDGLSVIEDLVYHYGELFTNSSAMPIDYVFKIAREHVAVALNGDDESLLGCSRCLRCRQLDQTSNHGAAPAAGAFV